MIPAQSLAPNASCVLPANAEGISSSTPQNCVELSIEPQPPRKRKPNRLSGPHAHIVVVVVGGGGGGVVGVVVVVVVVVVDDDVDVAALHHLFVDDTMLSSLVLPSPKQYHGFLSAY